MFATHFPSQPLAMPGQHYRAHGRICAALPSRFGLGTRLTLIYCARGHRYVLRDVLVADRCGRDRIDLPTGTYRDLITCHGGDSGKAQLSVKVQSFKVQSFKVQSFKVQSFKVQSFKVQSCKHMSRSRRL